MHKHIQYVGGNVVLRTSQEIVGTKHGQMAFQVIGSSGPRPDDDRLCRPNFPAGNGDAFVALLFSLPSRVARRASRHSSQC